MDTEPAGFDHLDDLLYPDLAAIIDFQSAVWPVAAVIGRENQRVKYRLVFWVEGAVEKYAGFVRSGPIVKFRHAPFHARQ
jgi:hypothetical protein